jgi:hypothetical protein
MAVNDQYKGEFMPGISAGAPNLSPGTTGASGPGADSADAGPVTSPDGGWQPASRFSTSTSGTVLAGQVDDSPVSPGPASGPGNTYGDTGAGSGRPSHFPRRSWQQEAS